MSEARAGFRSGGVVGSGQEESFNGEWCGGTMEGFASATKDLGQIARGEYVVRDWNRLRQLAPIVRPRERIRVSENPVTVLTRMAPQSGRTIDPDWVDYWFAYCEEVIGNAPDT